VRTAAFFSPHDPYNFAAHLLRTLSAGEPMQAASDLVVSPTYVPDLVEATLDLLIDGDVGIRHLANAGETSWAEFASRLAASLGLPTELVQPTPHAELGWPARRPRYAALATERGQVLPPLEHAIARFAAHAGEFLAPQRPAEAVGAERAR
jgi:dTDP-4-dehydrorhamnose reductase